MSRIFSAQDRQDAYDFILSVTRECGSIVALVQVGSGAEGFRDERSDLDFVIALDSDDSMAKVMDYKFEQAVPYSPEYLAGIPAERYTVGLNESWERARVQTDKDIRRALEYKNKVILYVTRLITRFYNVKFRYLLAPMYFATYTFGKKTYQVIINGQTGKTIFPVPRYLTKMIILAVIAGIFILVTFFGLTYLFPDSPLLWMYRLLN